MGFLQSAAQTPWADEQPWAKWARLSPSPGLSPLKLPDPGVPGGRSMAQAYLDGRRGRDWRCDHQA